MKGSEFDFIGDRLLEWSKMMPGQDSCGIGLYLFQVIFHITVSNASVIDR